MMVLMALAITIATASVLALIPGLAEDVEAAVLRADDHAARRDGG
jgi:hypothetical protein